MGKRRKRSGHVYARYKAGDGAAYSREHFADAPARRRRAPSVGRVVRRRRKTGDGREYDVANGESRGEYARRKIVARAHGYARRYARRNRKPPRHTGQAAFRRGSSVACRRGGAVSAKGIQFGSARRVFEIGGNLREHNGQPESRDRRPYRDGESRRRRK